MKDRTMRNQIGSCRKLRRLIEAGRLLAGLLKRPGHRKRASHARRANFCKSTAMKPRSRGEWIHLKRIEADLSRENLAQKLCVGDRTVQSWEHDQSLPTDAQWRQLKELLH